MERLKAFVSRVEAAVERARGEPELLDSVRDAMRELVATDDWLPPQYTQPHPQYYQQYLLHRDPAGRFSVVSFVWGPGQRTPIHDHTVWGVIGLLRGAEHSQQYERSPAGMVASGEQETLRPGDVAAVSPAIGDIHRVSNAYDDRVSISIHAYGADIGKQPRHVYDPATGAAKDFISGYSTMAGAA